MKTISIEEQIKVIRRGVKEIITEEDLRAKLENSQRERRPLRVKFGADPTTPDLHLGHAVSLHKLRDLQDLGHEIIYLIGDFTARVGDPSGRLASRPFVDDEAIFEYAKTYEEHVFKILDRARTNVRFNGEWLRQMPAKKFAEITSGFTVARMLEHASFQERYSRNDPISLAEFMYPLLQAYDSVELRADIEIGGEDQRFNLVVARHLQSMCSQEREVAILMPLLIGTDGVQKMSKSLGNFVALNDSAEEILRKILSIPDDLVLTYYQLVSRVPTAEIEQIGHDLENGCCSYQAAKERLALEIITIYHGKAEATSIRQMLGSRQ